MTSRLLSLCFVVVILCSCSGRNSSPNDASQETLDSYFKTGFTMSVANHVRANGYQLSATSTWYIRGREYTYQRASDSFDPSLPQNPPNPIWCEIIANSQEGLSIAAGTSLRAGSGGLETKVIPYSLDGAPAYDVTDILTARIEQNNSASSMVCSLRANSVRTQSTGINWTPDLVREAWGQYLTISR